MRNKSKLMIVMCIMIAIMAVGYGAFSTVLNITGTASITSEWKIVFSSITQQSKTSGVTIKTQPQVSGTSATFNVGLTSPGDKIVYKITLANQGTIDAIITDIEASASDSPAIIFKVEGVNIGDTLTKKTTKDFIVTIEYDPNITTQPDKLNKTLTVNILTEQKINQSITPSTPNIDQPLLSQLRYKILNDNIAYADNIRSPYVDSDTGIDFSEANYTYDEIRSTTAEVVRFDESKQYNFHSSILFDASKGTYDIRDGKKKVTWSSMSSDYSSSPYVCEGGYNTGCKVVYKMISYISPTEGMGYKYTVTEQPIEDNGKGLYYTSTNTENNETTYYFRGDVNNNYVKMGQDTRDMCVYNGEEVLAAYGTMDEWQCTSTPVCMVGSHYYVGYIYEDDVSECTFKGGTPTNEYATYIKNAVVDILWRIVRINEDGSIRMIMESEIFEGYPFNYPEEDNAYVGYMYGATGQTGNNAYNLTHSNDNPSMAKTYLEQWYKENLETNYSSYLSDAGFCNDRSVATNAGIWKEEDTALGYGNKVTYYGSYNRVENLKQPQFACPNEERDLFTTSTSAKGNKTLTYPIGLITLDEAVYAGASVFMDSSYYLNNGLNSWTMTPHSFSYTRGKLWFVGRGFGEGYEEGYRPVVNLKPTVELSTELPSGCTKLDGTEACPYIIKTN